MRADCIIAFVLKLLTVTLRYITLFYVIQVDFGKTVHTNLANYMY